MHYRRSKLKYGTNPADAATATAAGASAAVGDKDVL